MILRMSESPKILYGEFMGGLGFCVQLESISEKYRQLCIYKDRELKRFPA